VDGWVPIFFLMVVLKIPVGFLLYIAWWAFHAQPEPEEAPAGPDGDDQGFKRFRRDPTKPRGPRRGPHAPDALPLPPCPPAARSRVFTPPAPARAAAAHVAQRGSAEPAER
jgi:hypothetical protein